MSKYKQTFIDLITLWNNLPDELRLDGKLLANCIGLLEAPPTTDTITIDRANYESMKADAERWQYCVERKKFPIYINHGLEETEDWHINMGIYLIIEDTPEKVIDKARKI